MSLPQVVAVVEGSSAARAGLLRGDEILSVNGQVPRDIIAYQILLDEAELEIELRRGGLELSVTLSKDAGAPLGAEVSSALFDRVRTCDNHCEFCFIHQLPKGMRRSLYMRDDDYRLSFLYGNFTTLTRFTEADLERVIDEALSPLFVSIHATDPQMRAKMLRNPRGATSLRWLKALLEAGIEVHGQVVVCPGVNDAEVLEDTLTGILDEYPRLTTTAVVPLGVSRWSPEAAMRPHTTAEAGAVIDLVEEAQECFVGALGRRLVYAADEYYLMAGRPFPEAGAYDGFPQHENGIGIARAFAGAFDGDTESAFGPRPGFFAWVDGAPAQGYRAQRTDAPRTEAPRTEAPRTEAPRTEAPRTEAQVAPISFTRQPRAPRAVGILTGGYGAMVLQPLVDGLGRSDVRVLPVRNDFFGGNIAVTGLMVGADIARVLASEPVGDRYLLPDVCLSEGRFLDGLRPQDLPRPVEVVPTDGLSLRRALGARR
jgi:putative radical SAM enzyme (TIGR03279 family)